MSGPEIEAFLTHLAVVRNVSPHKQALSALLFLYREVPQQEVAWMQDIGRSRGHPHLPVMFILPEAAHIRAARCKAAGLGPDGDSLHAATPGAGLALTNVDALQA
ncbi:hypothetical protein RD110_05350 [Rhodoferax koreense]|uniref:Integrase SAM-like N-terminal domain-containing protein n=1 Tax=Rhodoferax koreensis TaxID=1842727 RepID=A0A1P8JSI3_9BURK|nr:phage integrase N-terminal SAM-like domain-containing protein [Rhodoferax koreense]APW36688.1 hypothetical protein RD110_05350 [Rhodoferax koreense]